VQQLCHLHRKVNPSNVEEETPFKNTYMSCREKILVKDLEGTEARNDCAGKDQQQFSQLTVQTVEKVKTYGAMG
jgi:hypothetical protein